MIDIISKVYKNVSSKAAEFVDCQCSKFRECMRRTAANTSMTQCYDLCTSETSLFLSFWVCNLRDSNPALPVLLKSIFTIWPSGAMTLKSRPIKDNIIRLNDLKSYQRYIFVFDSTIYPIICHCILQWYWWRILNIIRCHPYIFTFTMWHHIFFFSKTECSQRLGFVCHCLHQKPVKLTNIDYVVLGCYTFTSSL